MGEQIKLQIEVGRDGATKCVFAICANALPTTLLEGVDKQESESKEALTAMTTISLTSRTPIFLQAAKKLSTFLRHLAADNFGWGRNVDQRSSCYCLQRLTTAGDGTWMELTDLGEQWLAIWQSTTPSVRDAARSSPRDTCVKKCCKSFPVCLSSFLPSALTRSGV